MLFPLPEYFGFVLDRIGVTRKYEQKVGETVQIPDYFMPETLRCREFHGKPLGPPADGS